MQGLSVKLPIRYDEKHGGYGLHTEFEALALQNFKNLILTAPGERMMMPEFGVGLRNYLFLQDSEIESEINQKIREQAKFYMPYLTIHDIAFERALDPFLNNFINVKIFFRVNPVDVDLVLQAKVNDNTTEFILT
jgi:phage baseplate assembly protein W